MKVAEASAAIQRDAACIKWRRKASIKKSKIVRYALLRLGHLPQGAATSPMLANLVMRDADELLTSMADQLGMTYTRYADDLTFSTASPVFERQTARRVINKIYQVLPRYGLTPNLAKTTIVPLRSRKIVLGLQVDQDQPRLTRAFKMKMRMHLITWSVKMLGR